MRRSSAVPVVVAIGGFDPSCGAGVVADARSIEAMGALPMAVVTAFTIQSGTGLRGYAPVRAGAVVEALDEIWSAVPVAAVKLGQLPTAGVVAALARRFAAAPTVPVVLDPVGRASGGGALVSPAAAAASKRRLLPIAALVTVNLAEAGAIVGRRVASVDAMRRAAAEIEALGSRAVLVKGGHLAGDPVDVLRAGGREKVLRARRLRGSMHGTGCALAAAAAARIACGDSVEDAVAAARGHVRELVASCVAAGRARLRRPVGVH